MLASDLALERDPPVSQNGVRTLEVVEYVCGADHRFKGGVGRSRPRRGCPECGGSVRQVSVGEGRYS